MMIEKDLARRAIGYHVEKIRQWLKESFRMETTLELEEHLQALEKFTQTEPTDLFTKKF